MSKVAKALQQAARDRALAGTPRSAEPVETVDVPLRDASPAVTLRPAESFGPAPAPWEPDGIEPHLVSLLDPVSFEAEQYRTLRHIVEQAHRADQPSILAVSAPSIGDGKTITAINLAGALAQAPDTRVLLVDADLRRPAVRRRLALDAAGRGLVDAILDPALSLGDVVQRRAPFNLSVLPAGPQTASPYELLKSPRFGQLLDEARRQFDYVVLDAPPLVPIPDCRIIAKHVDTFLLVVTAHKTSIRSFDEALAALAPSSVLALVFNAGDIADSRAYYAAGYSAASGQSRATNGHRPWYLGGMVADRLLGGRAAHDHREDA